MLDIVTLEDAKAYLRVDYSDEDNVIAGILQTAQVLCRDVARLSSADWDEAVASDEMKPLLKGAVLYTLAYLSEHREEADHHDLVLTLRSLLFSIREGKL